MNPMKKYLLTAAGLLVLAGVLNVTQAGHVMAQAVKDIVVANSPSQPIPTTVQTIPPITGDVRITNMPAVSLQPGSTVGISPSNNTVRIGGVVSVSDVANANRQPAELLIATTFPDGLFVLTPNACMFVGGTCIASTVPPGKRLVIESAGADIWVPPGQKVVVDVLGVRATGGITHPLPTTLQGTFFGRDIFQGARELRLYADPGMSVGAVVYRDSNSGVGSVFVTFSGYFVDM